MRRKTDVANVFGRQNLLDRQTIGTHVIPDSMPTVLRVGSALLTSLLQFAVRLAYLVSFAILASVTDASARTDPFSATRLAVKRTNAVFLANVGSVAPNALDLPSRLVRILAVETEISRTANETCLELLVVRTDAAPLARSTCSPAPTARTVTIATLVAASLDASGVFRAALAPSTTTLLPLPKMVRAHLVLSFLLCLRNTRLLLRG